MNYVFDRYGHDKDHIKKLVEINDRAWKYLNVRKYDFKKLDITNKSFMHYKKLNMKMMI